MVFLFVSEYFDFYKVRVQPESSVTEVRVLQVTVVTPNDEILYLKYNYQLDVNWRRMHIVNLH